MKKVLFTVTVAVIILLLILAYLQAERNLSVSADVQKPVIIIDAGHGGFDGGAVGSDGTVEKDINLSIALKTDNALRKAGYKTLLTRKEDVSLETEGDTTRSKKKSDIMYRFSLMEKYDNCIYLSIHQNHFGQSYVKGAQVFYGKHPFSKELAQAVQSSIKENVQPDNKRVIKPINQSVYIVNNAQKPALLIECGFLSNSEDLSNLKDEKYQQKIALAIAKAVEEL